MVTRRRRSPAGKFERLPQEQWECSDPSDALQCIALARLSCREWKRSHWGRISTSLDRVKQPSRNRIRPTSCGPAVTDRAHARQQVAALRWCHRNNIMPRLQHHRTRRRVVNMMAEKKDSLPKMSWRGAEKEIPMRRMGTPSEFAALAAFRFPSATVTSPERQIPVDGGWIRALM